MSYTKTSYKKWADLSEEERNYILANVTIPGKDRDDAPNGKKWEFRAYTGADGKTYYLVMGNKKYNDDYKINNDDAKGTRYHLDAAIQYYLEYGDIPRSSADLKEYSGYDLDTDAWNNVVQDLQQFLNVNKIDRGAYTKAVANRQYSNDQSDSLDDDSMDTSGNPKQDAYNSYYRDLYSLEDNTLGNQMLNNFTRAEEYAALSNMQLAEAQYQQAAMQQAEVVKSITDQVKAERMAKLRAGMSESQIANQDMQIMLNNMNTLNQQAITMNQNRLAAQQQYGAAQDTAYQQYITAATNMGNVGAAMAASDAGDAYMQALKYQQQTGTPYVLAHQKVTQ